MIVKSGSALGLIPAFGLAMKRLRANRLCQACSVITRIGQPVRGIGAREAVLDEEVLDERASRTVALEGGEVAPLPSGGSPCPRQSPARWPARERELVVRRAAGVRARPADERPLGRNDSLTPPDGVFVQRRGRKIPGDRRAWNPALKRWTSQ